MKMSQYLTATAAEIYHDLRERNKLHLLDDIVEEGLITTTQYRDILTLKEALNDRMEV